MTESSFGGQAGTIYTRTWEVDGAHGAVVLVHGYGEHIGRYEHVAKALNDAGWSVHGLDHVGHGRVLGFPLGFFPSGMFSGFGSYLAELYPTRARGAGQGFCYNFGRAAGALFPFLIGILSESIGLTAAIALGAAAYGLSLVALLALPETRGRRLAVD